MDNASDIPSDQIIKHGDYVIIQRQNYTKLHKFTNGDSTSMLGKDHIKLQNINGYPYYSSFKMILKDAKKRIYTLEHCKNIQDLKEEFVDRQSGVDNRNIQDDGQSQKLSTEDINRLKENDLSSTEIVSQLVENSKTFSSKTEYSQEKYIKKKEKKYFEFLQIRKPSIRLLADIFYRQDPGKVLGLRCDSLTQLLCYSNINALGSFLLYESGTNGLVTAAIMNGIGAKTKGTLIHMHPGNLPQQQGLLALNLPQEQKDRCISVNIYSVLRHYYQTVLPSKNPDEDAKKRKLSSDLIDENDGILNSKRIKIDVNNDESVNEILQIAPESVETDHVVQLPWQIANAKACEFLEKGLDSLIIVAKEHPSNLVKALLPFVRNSAPIVIFSLPREPLVNLYSELKQEGNITGIRITSSWMRTYQVLPERTHPDVNMNSNSGYLLTGWVVQSKLNQESK